MPHSPAEPIISSDCLTQGALDRYLATLDAAAPADGSAPQGIHWCLCLPDAPTAGLGPDGHPPVGDDLPEVRELPRRMWASSDVRFHALIRPGAAIQRHSAVTAIKQCTGKTGPLVFVTWHHRTLADGVPCVTEDQHLVYRAPSQPGRSAAPVQVQEPDDDRDWTWRRSLTPTGPLLFRFSALTFNAHRIHYDRPYAQGEEGYPDLVVHGPLMATLLLDLVQREMGHNSLAHFSFRAVAPAFVEQPLQLLGRRDGDAVELRVRGAAGQDHVTATATLRA